MQVRAHAPQARLDVAIARVEAVEVRVRDVGLALRGENRHDDQRKQAQQRDGDDRPRPENASGSTSCQMRFGSPTDPIREQAEGTSCLEGNIISGL